MNLFKYIRLRCVRFLEYFSLDSGRRFAKQSSKRISYCGNESLVLIEANLSPLSQLALKFSLPAVCKFFSAAPVSYCSMPAGNLVKIKEKIRHYFSFYRIIGVETFYLFNSNVSNPQNIIDAKTILAKIETKDAFENIQYRNILIGDLVYDHFLRTTHQATLDLMDSRLVGELARAILFVDQVYDYMTKNNVRAVFVGETCYRNAIPARVAIHLGAKAFYISGQFIYNLDKDVMHASLEAHFYPEIFQGLPKSIQLKGIKAAQQSLKNFEGSQTFIGHEDELSFPKESFNNRLKILIMAHDFFDSPHAYGTNLFPDSWEWLNAIGEISSNSNHLWFLKAHPYARAGNEVFLSRIAEKFPNLHLVKKETPKNALVQMGLDAVLTVYGTAGSEFPIWNIPVVNASRVNPHVKYSFNIHPQSREEFISILSDLPNKLKNFNFQFESLLEFYFMHHIYRRKSFLFKNYEQMCEVVETTRKGMTWNVFRYTGESYMFSAQQIEESVSLFLESGDYFLSRAHSKTISYGV